MTVVLLRQRLPCTVPSPFNVIPLTVILDCYHCQPELCSSFVCQIERNSPPRLSRLFQTVAGLCMVLHAILGDSAVLFRMSLNRRAAAFAWHDWQLPMRRQSGSLFWCEPETLVALE
ncbi:hypothetical protein BCR44DRAFT_1312310 [Catenaria anguillulae PL171]|uniref:Uncharacterized protein n=1 Tax=Catenaria anguillulae PL171 TaxID=765915 RepID=A0A1Y2H7C2_9FUNG|nr:hypothetical protein BCR44DRAFT_1312310 [Catenaria anguillulae PL171]